MQPAPDLKWALIWLLCKLGDKLRDGHRIAREIVHNATYSQLMEACHENLKSAVKQATKRLGMPSPSWIRPIPDRPTKCVLYEMANRLPDHQQYYNYLNKLGSGEARVEQMDCRQTTYCSDKQVLWWSSSGDNISSLDQCDKHLNDIITWLWFISSWLSIASNSWKTGHGAPKLKLCMCMSACFDLIVCTSMCVCLYCVCVCVWITNMHMYISMHAHMNTTQVNCCEVKLTKLSYNTSFLLSVAHKLTSNSNSYSLTNLVTCS